MRDVDIEELLRWTYQVQRAHVTERSAMARTGWGPSIMSRFGCVVDSGGYAPAITHDDADLVHATVQNCCDNSQLGMVIRHAASGIRPDDGSSIELRAKLDYVEMDRSGRRPKVSWLRWTGTDSEVEFARTVYLHWWVAVDRVAAELQGKPGLREFRVTGFLARREPWLTIATKT